MGHEGKYEELVSIDRSINQSVLKEQQLRSQTENVHEAAAEPGHGVFGVRNRHECLALDGWRASSIHKFIVRNETTTSKRHEIYRLVTRS